MDEPISTSVPETRSEWTIPRPAFIKFTSPGAIGTAVGVVAAGFDRPYPRRHQVLHQQVAQRGALLAEVPLGGQPLPWRFPARNRIIAALADAVVVVESRSKGGSMLTAAEALKRGTSVMAVPGHPNSAQAAGALDLIFDGAPPHTPRGAPSQAWSVACTLEAWWRLARAQRS